MRTFIAFSVLLLISACQTAPPPEMTEADRQAVAAEVHQACMDWFASWGQNDLEGAMAPFAEDLAAYFVSDPALFMNNLDLLPTAARVRGVFGPALEARSATKMTLGNEFVAVIDRDHAVQVFDARWSVTDLEGVTTPDYPLTGTVVWVREGGVWKILHYHQTWTEETE
jgi:hypothetical protein